MSSSTDCDSLRHVRVELAPKWIMASEEHVD